MSLKNKTAVVCGSTQGIGWETAKLLANKGATIVLVARNEETLNKRVTELSVSEGQKHSFIVADFSKPEALKQKLTEWTASGNKANILINNTGGPKGGPI